MGVITVPRCIEHVQCLLQRADELLTSVLTQGSLHRKPAEPHLQLVHLMEGEALEGQQGIFTGHFGSCVNFCPIQLTLQELFQMYLASESVSFHPLEELAGRVAQGLSQLRAPQGQSLLQLRYLLGQTVHVVLVSLLQLLKRGLILRLTRRAVCPGGGSADGIRGVQAAGDQVEEYQATACDHQQEPTAGHGRQKPSL